MFAQSGNQARAPSSKISGNSLARSRQAENKNERGFFE
jgi:hypothetical protein